MIKPIILICFLSLAVAFNSYAHDSDELEELEKELQDIKKRLSDLESSSKKQSAKPEKTISSEGWKSVVSWRKISKGMAPSDVRRILGEPHRIDGGTFAKWYYQNGGRVHFYEGRVDRWSEPRE